MAIEEFAPIQDYSIYLVSESGRVWSEDHISSNGSQIKGRMRAVNFNRAGYPGLWMRRDDGQRVYRYIHQLVAEAFIGPRPDGLCVLHIDNNPGNNHHSNLKYGTQSENIQQAYRENRKFATGGKKCRDGCACGRHFNKKCRDGCSCGRHFK